LTVHRKNCSTQEHVADKSHPQLPKEDTHAHVICVCCVSQRCIAAYSTMMQMTYTSQIECSQFSKQENALSHWFHFTCEPLVLAPAFAIDKMPATEQTCSDHSLSVETLHTCAGETA